MYRLLRNFTITATSAFVLTAAVSYLVHQRLLREQYHAVGEERNVVLVKILGNSLGRVYEELLDPTYSGDDARRRRNLTLLAQKIKEHLSGTDITNLKLWDAEGNMVFSSQEPTSPGHDVLSDRVRLALTGETISEWVEGERNGGSDHSAKNVLETYVPLWLTSDAEPTGVMEVYSDITPMIQAIRREGVVLAVIQTAVLIALYFVLFLIVRHADRVIRQQHHDGERYVTKLNEAKEAAEAGARAKSEFLANMSHEIRTPLNAMIGYTDLLRRAKLGEKERKYVDTVNDSGRALLALIDDILSLSKIDADELDTEESEFDIRDVVEGVVEMLANEANSKGLELRARFHMQRTVVVGDADRLRHVLVNLVGNAIKFTDRGAVTVGVTQERADHNHSTVRFEVQDTGIGIAPQHRERLFQPFSQIDASSMRAHGGTGLGLVISKRLTELMGGSIGVESEPGRGSTFWFRLPFAQSAPIADRALGGHPTRDGNHRRSRPRRSAAERAAVQVLVAEDNPVGRELICEMVAGLGYTVSAVADGDKVVDAMTREPADILLLDCQMPGMDGYEVARLLRRRFGPDELVIIAVSADVSRGVRQRCLDAGMDDYLSKPLLIADLAIMLDTWLTRIFDTPPRGRHSKVSAPDHHVPWPFQDVFPDGTMVPLDRERAMRLLAIFLEDSQKRLNEIRRSLRAGQWQQAARTAHSLKGGCQQIGAEEMVAHCQVLCGEGDSSASEREAAISGLAAELERLRYWLDQRSASQPTRATGPMR